MAWVLAFAGVALAAALGSHDPLYGLAGGALLASCGFGLYASRWRRRHRVVRHVLAGGKLLAGGSGEPQTDQLLELLQREEPAFDEGAVLNLLSQWSDGRIVEAGAGSEPISSAINRVRAHLLEEREGLRAAAARLVEAAEKGQNSFLAPAREIERCAESLRRGREEIASDAELLFERVEALQVHAMQWEQEGHQALRDREAAVWSRRQLGRALDMGTWSTLDREAAQIASALQRLIGHLERDPDSPERMVWLGQARGQAEALERHRSAVNQGVEGARQVLMGWKPLQERDREALDGAIARIIEALRGLAESWRQQAVRAEAAAAAAVAEMPDVEWWVSELARLQWDMELELARGSSGPRFQSSLQEILERQRQGRTPAAAALARGLERLEARISEHSDELDQTLRRLERLRPAP